MARCTSARVVSRTLGWWLSTRETVWCETPATWATSAIVGARPRRACPSLCAVCDMVLRSVMMSLLALTAQIVKASAPPTPRGAPPSLLPHRAVRRPRREGALRSVPDHRRKGALRSVPDHRHKGALRSVPDHRRKGALRSVPDHPPVVVG
ncbi:hypothetical protein SCOCK_340043 [Actinacidiphila cocklensis]|uniref:Uncharacterized protein n=1 Tax=Actinacidiphila cocklensis TaxID=887465 RepID=A0A9W4GS94_9ACTN|nr:hypothetical protein SCOCK_340043 [Actinacidiphila cocklensis]